MTMKHIEIVPYSLDWPKMFEAESTNIKEALGDNCIAIHHIGSTSVPGLAAKSIIDLIPVVLDITAVDSKTTKMSALGYEPKGEYGIPFRRYFQKGTDRRSHNVHVFETDHTEIDRHLKFRDWMRLNKRDKEAYAELKSRLAEQFPNDILSYGLGKEEFIATIDAKSGWDGIRIVIALTPKEWNAYHRIKKEQIFAPIHVLYDRNHPTLTAENHFHFVLYKGAEIVSVAHIEFLNSKEATLRSLATDEGYKRRGFGMAMMQLLERWSKHQGRNIIKIHSALRAEAFYRKLGYTEMPFDDPPISKDIIDLGKVLSK